MPPAKLKTRRNTFFNAQTGLLDKPMIYTYLRHHYILEKSIVVIIDDTFSSFYFQKLANQIAKTLLEKLEPTDHFGAIQMTKNLEDDNVKLEEKSLNAHIKERYLSKLVDAYDNVMKQRKRGGNFEEMR